MEAEKQLNSAAKHYTKVSLLPATTCRGPSGLLPFGSAPWTSPVALLGYWDQDRLGSPLQGCPQ